ncbi:Outer dense fiber protein 1 [Lonchura striata]|uniref:Outer dense fiber protein 1 n=1 Tax=Lonchura striata TaxID=40157 RepID=A0A218U8W1_9PASE|nr:Outer dense fiber protein 1 [Lonchura striata domestica]
MSTHCYFETENLRHIQRQMKMMDLRLQLLREKLCAARLHRTKRLGMMLNSCSGKNLALIDVKGFDPKDITVTVKDGKVTVSAERKVECSTGFTKTCNYKRFVKEFCLPPGVDDKEVTYSVESKCSREPAKSCLSLCNF